MSVKRTNARILYTFYWPTIGQDCQQYIQTCKTCQLKAPVTYCYRVPIKPIPRADSLFLITGLQTAPVHSLQLKIRRSSTSITMPS